MAFWLLCNLYLTMYFCNLIVNVLLPFYLTLCFGYGEVTSIYVLYIIFSIEENFKIQMLWSCFAKQAMFISSNFVNVHTVFTRTYNITVGSG